MAARLSPARSKPDQIEAVVGYVASIIITTEQGQGKAGRARVYKGYLGLVVTCQSVCIVRDEKKESPPGLTYVETREREREGEKVQVVVFTWHGWAGGLGATGLGGSAAAALTWLD